jgi:hypothetical protein
MIGHRVKRKRVCYTFDMTDEDSEVCLNVLLAEGVDVATAYAASLPDGRPPAPAAGRQWFGIAMLAGVLAGGIIGALLR